MHPLIWIYNGSPAGYEIILKTFIFHACKNFNHGIELILHTPLTHSQISWIIRLCSKPLFFKHTQYSVIVQLRLWTPSFFVHAQNSVMASIQLSLWVTLARTLSLSKQLELDKTFCFMYTIAVKQFFSHCRT